MQQDIGVANDFTSAWIAGAATVVFGAVHATIASRVLDGRRRTNRLRVSAPVAGHEAPAFVITGLVLLGVLTVATALAVHADGARHPATVASVFVAAIVLLGGPHLLALVRRRAAVRAGAAAA